MVRFGYVLVIGIGLLGRSADAKAPFSSKTGRFSFDFPTKPKETVEPLDTSDGKLVIHTFNADLSDGGVAVVYFDYPNDGGVTPAVRIDRVVDSEVEGMDGRLVSPKTTCDEGPILCRYVSYVGDADGEKMAKTMRFYLVGRRVYSAYVVTAARRGTSPVKIRHLLDSMHIDVEQR